MYQRALTILGLGALCALLLGVVVGLVADDAHAGGVVGQYVMIATAVVIIADAGRRRAR